MPCATPRWRRPTRRAARAPGSSSGPTTGKPCCCGCRCTGKGRPRSTSIRSRCGSPARTRPPACHTWPATRTACGCWPRSRPAAASTARGCGWMNTLAYCAAPEGCRPSNRCATAHFFPLTGIPIMKLWYQLVSSETGMQHFIAATQALCDSAAAPDTQVDVRGTRQGALGDQYRLFWNYDVREIIDNALRIRKEGGYDAFVLANSLDPALVELREIMDIPVVSFMEVCCFHACTMGERFGLVVPNMKMVPRYREIPIGYGLRDSLSSVEGIEFENIRGFGAVFTDQAP